MLVGLPLHSLVALDPSIEVSLTSGLVSDGRAKRREEERQLQLRIERGQEEQTDRKGRSQGVSFELKSLLVLTPEEQALVARYQIDREPLSFMAKNVVEAEYEHRLTTTGTISPLDVGGLTQGFTCRTKKINLLLQIEEDIKEACAGLSLMLEALESYGGEENIEF